MSTMIAHERKLNGKWMWNVYRHDGTKIGSFFTEANAKRYVATMAKNGVV